MSSLHKRNQFRTLLKCGRCGATGHAVWEENSNVSSDGPMGALISIADNFFLHAHQGHQGQPVIACRGCGMAQPD